LLLSISYNWVPAELITPCIHRKVFLFINYCKWFLVCQPSTKTMMKLQGCFPLLVRLFLVLTLFTQTTIQTTTVVKSINQPLTPSAIITIDDTSLRSIYSLEVKGKCEYSNCNWKLVTKTERDAFVSKWKTFDQLKALTVVYNVGTIYDEKLTWSVSSSSSFNEQYGGNLYLIVQQSDLKFIQGRVLLSMSLLGYGYSEKFFDSIGKIIGLLVIVPLVGICLLVCYCCFALFLLFKCCAWISRDGRPREKTPLLVPPHAVVRPQILPQPYLTHQASIQPPVVYGSVDHYSTQSYVHNVPEYNPEYNPNAV